MTDFADVPTPVGWTYDDIAGLELAIRAEVVRQMDRLLSDPARLRCLLAAAEKREQLARRLYRR